jgi:hypothetical protein
MALIQVEPEGPGAFRVTVSEGESRTTHHVTLAAEDHARLTGGRVPETELIRLSFEFLLEREPKESILRHFAVPVIGRYFPEYERIIGARLGAVPGSR